MLWARQWLASTPRTFRSSVAIVWFSRTRRVLILCRKSLRMSEIFWWIFARRKRALCLFFEPLLLRESAFCARFNCAILRRSGRGAVDLLPSEVVAKAVSLRSIPIAFVAGGTAGKPAVSDLEKLARYFGVSLTAFFPESNPKSRTNALLSATADLDDADLDEVRLYALFRKSRRLTRRAK